MSVAASPTDKAVYLERPRCPPWIYFGFFLVPAGFGAVLLAIFQASSPEGDWGAAGVGVLLISALSGTLPRLSQRLVVVDDVGLHIGRNVIPINEIASTRGVEGAELKGLRHEIADIGVAWIGLTGVGPLSSVSRTGFDGDRVSWVTPLLQGA